MTNGNNIVLGYGRLPNLVCLVGEAPGETEFKTGRPFTGKSGEELEWYLSRYGLSQHYFYKTNVVKEYTYGNPDPTEDQISNWSSFLQMELDQCQPKLVIAVGRFAARWFIDDDIDIGKVHGIPHSWTNFNSNGQSATATATVIPVIHPASGFYDKDMKAAIMWDFSQVARVLKLIQSGEPVSYRVDHFKGKEQYRDVTGDEFADYLHSAAQDGITHVALDTEGYPSNPFSVQASCRAGEGVMLRCSQPDFQVGIDSLSEYSLIFTYVVHNYMYDAEMLRVMGFDIFDCQVVDTMYMIHTIPYLRVKAQRVQNLEYAAYRWCGMKVMSHSELVADLGTEHQVAYLNRVLQLDLPKPASHVELQNDGTLKTCRPWHVHRLVRGILRDINSGKVDKDGNKTDPLARWNKVSKVQRKPVEKLIGRMPIGSVKAVFEVDPQRAINYSCCDTDSTLRLHNNLKSEVPSSRLVSEGMAVLPIFEEMQSTGMPVSRSAFLALQSEMEGLMVAYQTQLSALHMNGEPFNPNSPADVRRLMHSRGLRAERETASGEDSTAKDSIEHLRYTDDAMALVFNWREAEHIRSAFCVPILDKLPDADDDSNDIHWLRCSIKPTRVHTRRLATSDPNLLAIPARTEIGLKVRKCFITPPGMVYGAWDLSQIEARVFASLCNDKSLIELFTSGGDIHVSVGSRTWTIPLDQVTETQRTAAKTITYGAFYGQLETGLSTQLRKLGIMRSPSQCFEDICLWFDAFPGALDYFDTIEDEIKSTGVITDESGMPRYLPGVWSNKSYTCMNCKGKGKVTVSARSTLVRCVSCRGKGKSNAELSEAVRTAVNHRVQGTAQTMIQRAMIHLKPQIRDLQKSGLNIKWCLEPHDELDFVFDEWLWPMMNDMVTTALTKHHGVELKVPVLAKGKCARSWGMTK